MLSRDGGGLQQDDAFLVSVSYNGEIMDATGIRQKDMDDTPNPIKIAMSDGIAPINAFPLSTFLQYIYCDVIIIPDAIKNPIMGRHVHKITVK